MKKINVKNFIALLMTVLLIVGCIPSMALAADTPSAQAGNAILKYVDAINDNDWDTIIRMSPEDEYQENVSFYNSEKNKEKNVGFHAITSAVLCSIDELNQNDLYDYTNAEYYFDTYGDLKLYLVGVDLTVQKESKYFYNGVNFFLVLLGKEDGVWKIVLFAQAPASTIETNLITTFATTKSSVDRVDVEKALNIIRARYQGIVLGGDGEVIDTNIATVEQLAEEKNVDVSELLTTTYATGDHARPSTISVYITSTGKIKDVDFYDYCKCVLPNEWYCTWKTESLKAGAQAVKFVGWYRVYNAKYPGKGYDVKDSTVDQAYKEGTEVASCTNAINAVGGIGMENSNNEIFYPSYRAGTSGTAGTKYGGILYQYGSQYLANQGYTYDNILDYYYSYSTVSPGAITTFSY